MSSRIYRVLALVGAVVTVVSVVALADGAKPEAYGAQRATERSDAFDFGRRDSATAPVFPQWSAATVPTGPRTIADGGWLISVSCAKAEKCAALGGIAHGGTNLPLVAALSNGSWHRVALPVEGPGWAPRGYVPYGLRCAGPDDCAAVGTYTSANGAHLGLAYTETGGHWRATTLSTKGLRPRPGRDPRILLKALSCAAPAYCAALASYQDRSYHLHDLVYELTGGRWVPEQVALTGTSPGPVPGRVSRADLESISCWAPGHCAIVGSYRPRPGPSFALVVTGGDGRWKAGSLPTVTLRPAPGSSASTRLTSVQCPTTAKCTAVGTYEDAQGEVLGLSGSFLARRWVAQTLPLNNLVPGPAGTVTTVPSALSCASAHFCVTVGTYRDLYGDVQGFADTLTAGKWQAWTLPTYSFEPPAKPRAVFGLTSVSCPAPGQCMATGFYGGISNETHGFVEQLAHNIWSGQTGPLGGLSPQAGGFPGSSLDAMQCPGPAQCVAVGYYSTLGGLVRPVSELYGP